MKQTFFMLPTLLLLFPTAYGPAHAEVIDQSEHGFSVRHQVTTSATPNQLYDALVNDVRQWWNPDHSYTGESENLRIDARVGGCFCEQLAGGSMQHMAIIYADRGKLLRMHGGLGPLQQIAAGGPLDWQIEKSADGAKLTVTYHVGGYLKGGLRSWAAPVDGVIGEQVQRLKSHADALVASKRAATVE